MINILVSHAGKRHTVEVTGHSGYAPSGSDIICAAVSTASTLLAQELALLSDLGDIEGLRHSAEGARIQIVFDVISDQAASVFKAFMDVMSDIAEQYPSNVRIIHGVASKNKK